VTPDLKDDLLPSIVVQGTWRDRLYAIGAYDSGLAIFGSRRYLHAAGVRIPTVAHPWTLAEFEAALQKLSAVRSRFPGRRPTPAPRRATTISPHPEPSRSPPVKPRRRLPCS
jgi:hypothetical protein